MSTAVLKKSILLGNSNSSTRFGNCLASGLGRSVHREDKLLLHLATTEEFHCALTADDAELGECGNSIRASGDFLLEDIKIEWLVDDLRRTPEATELGLTADERRLTSFEAKVSALTDAGLLTLRTTTSGRTGTGCVTASDALLIFRRTSVGLEGLEHGDTA